MTKLQLAPHNFRVTEIKGVPPRKWKKESSGLYIAPTEDVWAIDQRDDAEQLYAWDAAMRETARFGVRAPTDEEFSELVKTKDDIPNLVLTGYRNTDSNYHYRGTYTYIWSSSESGSSAWRRYLYSGYSTVYRNTNDKALGFSVRCLLGTKSVSSVSSSLRWTHTHIAERSDGIKLDGDKITIDGKEYTREELTKFTNKARAALAYLKKL